MAMGLLALVKLGSRYIHRNSHLLSEVHDLRCSLAKGKGFTKCKLQHYGHANGMHSFNRYVLA